jgi:hypothetical protein
LMESILLQLDEDVHGKKFVKTALPTSLHIRQSSERSNLN